jgi:hypothetical protein
VGPADRTQPETLLRCYGMQIPRDWRSLALWPKTLLAGRNRARFSRDEMADSAEVTCRVVHSNNQASPEPHCDIAYHKRRVTSREIDGWPRERTGKGKTSCALS